MKEVFKIICGLFFLISCSHSDSLCDKETKTDFEKYVCEIPVLQDNFTLECADPIEHINIESVFVPEGAGIVGRLNSINDYSLIIYSYPADIRLPILEIYDQNGEKLNEQPLLDMNDCSANSPTTSSRFRIVNEKTIIIEKIKPENGSVYNSKTIEVGALIKEKP